MKNFIIPSNIQTSLGGYITSIVNIGYDIPAGAVGIVVIPHIKNHFSEHNAGASHSNHQNKPEILGLCNTLDYEILEIIYQSLQKPNPTYYIGSGKVSEITKIIEEKIDSLSLEFVVFDCTLKPNQIFNLENEFHIRVLDRNTLILMIFLHHARTNEAKLQVEYAILKHQIPYVTELVRRAKMGEHPGYLAGGEYKVDEYFRLTKRRIKKIRLELKKIRVSREQRRKHRRRHGFELVTLAGYTNAGKSALLKVLTDASVPVDDRMFSTVSTKTRRFRNSKTLFTDTVGFIRDIPTQLIEAFKSTLEEIIFADHIMLVVDISEDFETVKVKIMESLKTIDHLISDSFIITGNEVQKLEFSNRPKYHLIFNKIDLEPNSELKAKKLEFELSDIISNHGITSIFLISCKTKFGVDEIINRFNNSVFTNSNV